jgi:hypothetical protein
VSALAHAQASLVRALYFSHVKTFGHAEQRKPGNYFLGGTKLDCDQIFVHGTIREGRPTDMKDALMARLTADIAVASQMKLNCVWVYLMELSPSQMVEFGHVLPLHGGEVEWSAALPEAEKARLEKIGIRKEVAA